jgi:hypothetical protein
LDLLLSLIERAELDITTVSLASVTDQYLEHLRSRGESTAGRDLVVFGDRGETGADQIGSAAAAPARTRTLARKTRAFRSWSS